MQWKILPEWKEAREWGLNNTPRYDLERKYSGNVITPFEAEIMGGTPRNLAILQQRGNTIEDRHTPMEILQGLSPRETVSIEEENILRDKIKFIGMGAEWIGFVKDKDLAGKMVAVSLEPLDPQTGVTIRDPKILGVWNKETDTVRELPERDLTKDYYRKLREEKELHPEYKDHRWNWVRDGKASVGEKEIESSRDPEKE